MFFDGWLDWTRSIKEFSESDAFSKISYLLELRSKIANATTIAPRSAPTAAAPSMTNFQSPQQNYGTFQGGNVTSLGPDGNVPLGNAADQAARASLQLSFLGSAATATDKYNTAVLKLNATVENNSTLSTLQSRAMAGLGLDRDLAQLSGYTGALGDFPTVQTRPVEKRTHDNNGKEGTNERDQRRLPAAA
jgi:hypothetical protein